MNMETLNNGNKIFQNNEVSDFTSPINLDLNKYLDIHDYDIGKKVIHDALSSREPNFIKSAVLGSVQAGVTNAIKPDRSEAVKVKIPETLTCEEERLLTNNYPSFAISFTRTITNQHAFAAASRRLEYAQCFRNISYRSKIECSDKDAYVNDIGGDFYKHFVEENKNVHICSPTLDSRDAHRYSVKYAQLDNFSRTNILTNYQRDLLAHIKKRNPNSKYMCNKKFGECDKTAVCGIMVQSCYDITLRELADGMTNKKINQVYGSFIFSSEILLQRQGVLRPLNCYYRWTKNKKYLTFSFEDDGAWGYTHRTRVYFSYLVSTWFPNSNFSEYFYLELMENKCGIQYFRVTKSLMSVNVDSIIHHKIWYSSLRNMTKITYYEISYDDLAVGNNKWWHAWKVFDEKNLRGGFLRPCTFYIDTDVLNRGIECALGSTETKFKPTEIYNFLRSYATRIFFGKDVVRRGVSVEQPDHLYHLANAIYLKVYAMKYDSGKITQQIINDINFERELSTSSLLGKLFKFRKNAISSNVWPLPLIQTLHGIVWLLKSPSQNIRDMIQKTIKFHEFNKVADEFDVYTVIYDQIARIPRKEKNLEFLHIPKFCKEDFVADMPHIVRRIIKDNWDADVELNQVNQIKKTNFEVKPDHDESVKLLDSEKPKFEEDRTCSKKGNTTAKDINGDDLSQNGDKSVYDSEISALTKHSTLSYKFQDNDTLDIIKDFRCKISKLTSEEYLRKIKIFDTEIGDGFFNRAEAKILDLYVHYMYNDFRYLRDYKILDLCAGPGGFLNFWTKRCDDVTGHYLVKTTDDFTINPEKFPNVKLIQYNDGDLLNKETIQCITSQSDRYDIISADGYIGNDVDDLNLQLLAAELNVISTLLKEGGASIVKFCIPVENDIYRKLLFDLLNNFIQQFGDYRICRSEYTHFLSFEFYLYCNNFKKNVRLHDFYKEFKSHLITWDFKLMDRYKRFLEKDSLRSENNLSYQKEINTITELSEEKPSIIPKEKSLENVGDTSTRELVKDLSAVDRPSTPAKENTELADFNDIRKNIPEENDNGNANSDTIIDSAIEIKDKFVDDNVRDIIKIKPDGNCCFSSMLCNDNEEVVEEFKKYLHDDAINNYVNIYEKDYGKILDTPFAHGTLDHIRRFSDISGVNYEVRTNFSAPVFTNIYNDIPSYTTRILRYQDNHYDAYRVGCIHNEHFIDFKFKFPLYFRKLLNKNLVQKENFYSFVEYCHLCVGDQISALLNTKDKLQLFMYAIPFKDILGLFNRSSMTFKIMRINKYYLILLEKQSNLSHDNREFLNIVKRVDFHFDGCTSCSDPDTWMDEITYDKKFNFITMCNYKRVIYTEIPDNEVDTILHVNHAGMLGIISNLFTKDNDREYTITLRGKFKVSTIVSIIDNIRRSIPPNTKTAKIYFDECNIELNNILAEWFKVVYINCRIILPSDQLIPAYCPKFITVEDFSCYYFNAMSEIGSFWGYNAASILNTLKKYYVAYKDIFENSTGVIDYLFDRDDIGVIDFSIPRWIHKPKQTFNSYEYGFDGQNLINIVDAFDSGRLKLNKLYGVVIVSAETRLIITPKLFRRIKDLDTSMDSMPKHIELIVGVPGCGKTHTILQKHEKSGLSHIVLTTTRDAALDLRNRAEKIFKVPKELLNKKYRTLDSFILHYDNKNVVDTLWVDEGLMSHFGQILWAAKLCRAHKVKIFGDPAQIPFINRDNSISIHYSKPDKYVQFGDNQSISHRCPADVMYVLHNMQRYDFIPKTTNKVLRSLNLVPIKTLTEMPHKDDVVYLCFTQDEKLRIKQQRPNLKEIYTIHEFQGRQHPEVILFRDNVKNIDIFNSLCHILVAISRHTRRFTYYTLVSDDTTAKNINHSIDDNELASYVVKLPGGGVFQEMPAFPDIKVTSASPYDFLKKNKILRDVVMNHGFSAHVPLKVDFECCEFLERSIELPLIPQATLTDPVNILQTYFDIFFPGESVISRQYDGEIFELDNYRIYADGFRFDDTVPYRFVRKDFKRSTLRTTCPDPIFQTQRQMIKAFSERNGAVPELSGDRDVENVVTALMRRFEEAYIDDNLLYNTFNNEPITPNVDDMECWIRTQGPDIFRDISNDSDFNIYDKELSVYKTILKRMPKPVLEPGGIFKYNSPQTIAFHDKLVNLIFCPLVREIKRRLIACLKLDKIIFSDMSTENFEKLLSKRFPPKLLGDFLNLLEVDFSKYDKSQDFLTLSFEIAFMRKFGVPEDLLTLWVTTHAYSQLWDPQTKFKAYVSYQRKSGDAMTFLGNTVFLMAVLAFTYNLDDEFCLFSGDDSLIFSRHKFRNTTESTQVLAGVFNLEAKLLRYKTPYFCSRFLLPVDADHWIVVPDVVKLLIKLGRNDMVDDDHVEEYRISLCDNIKNFSNALFNDAINEALDDRYKLRGDHTVLYMALYSFVKDKKIFHKNYYWQDNVDVVHYNIRPSLDI